MLLHTQYCTRQHGPLVRSCTWDLVTTHIRWNCGVTVFCLFNNHNMFDWNWSNQCCNDKPKNIFPHRWGHVTGAACIMRQGFSIWTLLWVWTLVNGPAVWALFYVCPLGHGPAVWALFYVCPLGHGPAVWALFYVCPLGHGPAVLEPRSHSAEERTMYPNILY